MTGIVSFGRKDACQVSLVSVRQDGYTGLRLFLQRIADGACAGFVGDLSLETEEVAGGGVGGNDVRRKAAQVGAESTCQLLPLVSGGAFAAKRTQLHAVATGRRELSGVISRSDCRRSA